MKNADDQRILVVDDEEMINELLSDYFRELGYDVTVALSAEEAIEKLEFENQFNLIITDIDLPGKSGFELLKIVKETKENLPVVILSGIKTFDNTIKAVKNGAIDFISKPFNAWVLLGCAWIDNGLDAAKTLNRNGNVFLNFLAQDGPRISTGSF